MAKKLKADDVIDVNDLASSLTKVITASFKKGAGEAFSGKDFLKDLKDQISEYNKSQEASIFNEKVRALAARTGLETREIELKLMTKQAQLEAKRAGDNTLFYQLEEQYKIRQKQLQNQIKSEKQEEKAAELAKRIKEYDHERHELLEKIKVQQELFKDIFTDQRAAQAIFIGQLLKGYENTKELFEEVRHEGHTVTQAFHETGLAISDAFSLSGASAKDSLEVMKGMRSEMGSVHSVTREARLEAASLAKTFGISNEEAGKLTAQFAMMPGATMESANNSLEFAGNLAKAAHVAPGEVMADIAKSSEEVATFTKDGGQNIGTAAVAAKKLGMEFGSLTKMADSLLDFQSSINKQMEASVLLGKEINLDKAREAALNGDLATMTQEVLANVGGEAEFNKMNVLQRKVLAESLGVSVQDLSKMVKNQDQLNKLTEKQQQALAAGELTMDEVLANASGFAGKLKEGAVTVGSMVMSFGSFTKGLKESVSFAKDLFGGFKEGVGVLGKLKGGVKGAVGLGGKGAEVAAGAVGLGGKGAEVAAGATDQVGKLGDAAKKAPSPQAGMGVRLFLKNLAAGLRSFGQNAGQTLKGAAVLVGAGVMLGVGLGAIGLAVKAMGGSATEMIAIGGALVLFAGSFYIMSKALGNIPVSAVIKGALAMVVLGAALIPAALAFMMIKDVPVENIIAFSIALPLLALAAAGLGFLLPFIAMGALGLAALGVGMIALGAGLMVLQAGKDGLNAFQTFLLMIAEGGVGAAVGLFALGSSLLLFATSAYIAFPGLMLVAAGFALLMPGLAAVSAIAQTGAIQILGEGLTMMGEAGPGLALVALSMMGIGAGLGMVALAGLAAMPVIGMLIGLAAVAPALAGLGKALGGMFGGGKGEESDKMDTLIAKIDQLIAVASQGGEVKMDGKKVGEVLRLGLNSSGIR